MGAWGHGSFQNDTAMDWLHKLHHTDDFTLIQKTLARTHEPAGDRWQFSIELEALAAAEIVASWLGHPPTGKQGLEEWVRQHIDWFTPDILALARKTVASIKSKSQLKENSSGNVTSQAAWIDSILDLERRLQD